MNTQKWLCTFFWKNHTAKNGAYYDGGYDYTYTDKSPVELFEELRSKYGNVMFLINQCQITNEEYEKYK